MKQKFCILFIRPSREENASVRSVCFVCVMCVNFSNVCIGMCVRSVFVCVMYVCVLYVFIVWMSGV